MIGFKENDFVTHWEDGMGKVILISDADVTIDFFGGAERQMPLERTKHYRKVSSDGLIANIYTRMDHVKNLIEQKSPEIIKLLIMDDGESGRRLAIKKVKSLLIGGDSNSEAWRKKLGLIEEVNWKKWWASVSKKMKKNPWFDMSKDMVSLRESPVNSVNTITDRFDAEEDPGRKMALCKQFLQEKDALFDAVISDKIAFYIDDLLNTSIDNDLLGQAVSVAVALEQKGVIVGTFSENSKMFSMRALMNSKMPLATWSKVYSFFCKQGEQDTYDHLLIFCASDKKLRETVHRRLSENKFQKVLKQGGNRRIALTEDQVDFVNDLGEGNKLSEGIQSLLFFTKMGSNDDGVLTFAKRAVQDFLASILVVKNIVPNVKDLVVEIVVEEKLKAVVYPFMNSVFIDRDAESAFFQDLLLMIGSEDIKRTLLTDSTAMERPEVFTSAVRLLINDDSASDKSRLDILAKVDGVLSTLKTDGFDIEGLRIAVAKIVSGRHLGNRGLTSLDSTSLMKLVTNRSGNLRDREGAIEILLGNKERDACLAVIPLLVRRIDVDDFVILRKIIDEYPEDAVTEDMMTSIFDEIEGRGPEIETSFMEFFGRSKVTERFAIFIAERDADWHKAHGELVNSILRDEDCCIKVAKFWLDKYLLSSFMKMDTLEILGEYLKGYPLMVFQVIREKYLGHAEEMRKELSIMSILNDRKIEKMIDDNKAQLMGAIDKVSQRYEEHLKSLVELPQELGLIRDAIALSGVAPDTEDLCYRLTVVMERISHMLRALEIIKRE